MQNAKAGTEASAVLHVVASVAMPEKSTQIQERTNQVMERLVRALLPQAQASEVLQGFCTDALQTTWLARHAELQGEAKPASAVRTPLPLPDWRLKRVCAFVEANIAEDLSLATLAAAAGLSRMHFAAQFRAATGMGPHSYVVQRRIQRAKAILAESQTPIVDVALSVGFQTQAHFTTVFKRIVGLTPLRWRIVRGESTPGRAAAGWSHRFARQALGSATPFLPGSARLQDEPSWTFAAQQAVQARAAPITD